MKAKLATYKAVGNFVPTKVFITEWKDSLVKKILKSQKRRKDRVRLISK